MAEHRDIQRSYLTATTAALTPPDLMEWFLERGLCRVAIEADPSGEVTEVVAPPVLLLGRGSADVRACPHPDQLLYSAKTLSDMSLDDYHLFLLRWFTRAIDADLVSCFVCRKHVRNDAPAEPWDGIFVDKELVAWLVMHFDCKRYLSREFKGYHPFELQARPAEAFDVTYD
jgi:hypothetical protein